MDRLQDAKCLSGKNLTEELTARFGISSENARKATQRAVERGMIRSSKPYTFGNKQYIYCPVGLRFGKDEVKSVAKTDRPPVCRILVALEESSGIISYYEALKITASPMNMSSSKISTLNDILEVIVGMKLGYERTDINGVKYILERTADNTRPEEEEALLMRGHYAKMVVDCTLLPDIVRWLQDANFIGENIPVYRNRSKPSFGAQHNNFLWDAFAYTRTTGINELVGVQAASQDVQTFVPMDVVLSREYTQVELDGFVSRVQVVIRSVKVGKRKVLPIIIYQTISDECRNKIKSLGFLSINIGSIFGKYVSLLLENVRKIQLLKREGYVRTESTIDEMLSVIEKTGQADGLRTLRGILFEYLMYPVIKTIYPNARIQQSVKIPKMISPVPDGSIDDKSIDKSTEHFEYDYVVESSNPNEIVIIEVKGYAEGYQFSLGPWDKKATVKWFFGNSFKSAKAFYEDKDGSNVKVTGCFITSAGFTAEALQWFDKPSNGGLRPKNLNLYYDREKLFDLLDQYNFSHIKKTINEYYIKDEN